MYGYGYRSWCKNNQCGDVRLHGIVKAATSGIKAIIQEEDEMSRKRDVLGQVNVLQTPIVPQVPIQENIVETPWPWSSEGGMPDPEVEDSEVAPRDGEPLAAEKSIAGPRVLKVHHSDVSTRAPTCLQEEQGSVTSDTASCADTEVWEPERKRGHPRRPRTGRRARARVRQERWEAARAEAGLEARGMISASQVGALLACITEDGSDEERRLRSGDVGSDSASEDEEGHQMTVAVACGGVKGAPGHPASAGPILLKHCVGDDSADEEIEQVASVTATREIDHAMLGALRPATALADGTGSMDSPEEGETTDECSDMEENDVAELAGWTDHVLWQEMEDGAKLLPAKLVLAMMHLQTTALEWQARFGPADPHDWPVEKCKLMIVDGARELEPKFRRVRAVGRHLTTTWKSPQHLNRDWSALLEWLEGGEDGPCWQHRRFKDLLDELDESRYSGEFGSENLQDEVSIRSSSLQEGWHQFQCYVDGLAAAQRRWLRRDADCTEQMNARLAKSLAGRALP